MAPVHKDVKSMGSLLLRRLAITISDYNGLSPQSAHVKRSHYMHNEEIMQIL